MAIGGLVLAALMAAGLGWLGRPVMVLLPESPDAAPQSPSPIAIARTPHLGWWLAGAAFLQVIVRNFQCSFRFATLINFRQQLAVELLQLRGARESQSFGNERNQQHGGENRDAGGHELHHALQPVHGFPQCPDPE